MILCLDPEGHSMKSHLLYSSYHMLRLTTCKHSYFMLFYELWQLACCRQQLCVRVCSTVCITISEQHFEHLKIVYTFNSLCSLWWWPAGDTDRFVTTSAQCPEHWVEWFCSYQHYPWLLLLQWVTSHLTNSHCVALLYGIHITPLLYSKWRHWKQVPPKCW